MPTKYRTGRPSLWDRWFGGDDVPDYYAYARETRDPIVFQEGPVNEWYDFWKGPLEGMHKPGVPFLPFVGDHEIKVSTTLGDPKTTLKHEQLHHTFPLLNDPDPEEARVQGLTSEDPRVREATYRLMKTEGVEADYDLIDKILRMRMGGK